MSHRSVLITADDFGLSDEIDQAIIELCSKNVIKRVSVMTNFSRSPEMIKELLTACPDINLSIHLNLTDGKPLADTAKVPSLVNKKNEFHGGRHYLVAFSLLVYAMKPRDVFEEWGTQIQKALDLNLNITEINSHGHLHLHPNLHKVTLQLAKEFNIPGIRLVNNTQSIKGCIYSFLSSLLFRKMQKEKVNCDFNNLETIGINQEGKLSTDSIINKISASKKRNIEVISHPALPGCRFHSSWNWQFNHDYQALSAEHLNAFIKQQFTEII
jgi:chitin disaccharide deacetylase